MAATRQVFARFVREQEVCGDHPEANRARGGTGQGLPGDDTQTRLKTIFVVDPLVRHQSDLARALGAQYHVKTFSDVLTAKAAAKAELPSLIMVAESAPPDGGLAAIQHLKATLGNRATAFIGMTRDSVSSFAESCRREKIPFLVKPVSNHALFDLITKSISQPIEDRWATLGDNERRALVQTIELFRAIPDQILSGEPVQYDHIKDSCGPLVTAVCNNKLSDVLSGVKGHDNYTYVHSFRIAVFLSHFGHELGLRGDDLLTLSTGGLIHDLGKVAIPHQVLNKPGKLTDDEWTVMKTHVDRGLEVIDCIEDVPRGVVTIAAQHHEKMDGTGYPRGLKAAELNELARMSAIVDVFGALTDERIYKPPHPPDKALAIMRDMGPNHLDQHLLGLFQEMLLDTASYLADV